MIKPKFKPRMFGYFVKNTLANISQKLLIIKVRFVVIIEISIRDYIGCSRIEQKFYLILV